MLRKLPNPNEAGAMLQELNSLIVNVDRIPIEKFKTIVDLLYVILELQKQNPGTIEPLRIANVLICEINKCDAAKIDSIRKIIKEAGKLSLSELMKAT